MVRTIHHLSASGGTLLSKCIAALPNVVLLSEINPRFFHAVHFNPTCLLQQYQAQYQGMTDDDARDFFQFQLHKALSIARRQGKALVLRDHAHSDIHRKNLAPDNSLLGYLGDYRTLSLVTVRDPLDSFVSGLKYDWWKSLDNDFEAYCNRYRTFLSRYTGVPVVRYEDFCREPQKVMRQICDVLALEFDSGFEKRFSEIRLTGDSGRGSGSIGLRLRREVNEELLQEAENSVSYQRICEEYHYGI